MPPRLSSKQLEDAMWAGDADRLYELAPCRCCCDEHTFAESCEAWEWFGCRGQNSMTRADEESWQRHYQQAHGIDIFAAGD